MLASPPPPPPHPPSRAPDTEHLRSATIGRGTKTDLAALGRAARGNGRAPPLRADPAWDPNFCVPKMARSDFSTGKFQFFPTMVTLVWGGGGSSYVVRPFYMPSAER